MGSQAGIQRVEQANKTQDDRTRQELRAAGRRSVDQRLKNNSGPK